MSRITTNNKTRHERGVRSRGSSCPTGSAPLPGQPVVRPNGVVETTSYRISPRRTLQTGDTVRLKKGPYWMGRAEDGTPVRVSMAERGRVTFVRYCELGRSRWIEATSHGRIVVLHVGSEEPSPTIPGFVRRPYVITGVRMKSGAKGREAK